MTGSRPCTNSLFFTQIDSSGPPRIAQPAWSTGRDIPFPAKLWKDARTANSVELAFAMARHRTGRTRNWLSRSMCLCIVFKLIEAAGRTVVAYADNLEHRCAGTTTVSRITRSGKCRWPKRRDSQTERGAARLGGLARNSAVSDKPG